VSAVELLYLFHMGYGAKSIVEWTNRLVHDTRPQGEECE
jgi:hypothetical protein